MTASPCIELQLPRLIIGALLALSANDYRPFDFSYSPDPREASWVDSVFNALSEEERIGQLFMLRAHDKDSGLRAAGGRPDPALQTRRVVFFQSDLRRYGGKQAALTNRYQSASPRLPLMTPQILKTAWVCGTVEAPFFPPGP
ncbi:MAG: hypothetical protein IPJ82_23090 [Lewinellaceae bacterium]|nr:hypothetical protein [Lewinellaceae bacterium]